MRMRAVTLVLLCAGIRSFKPVPEPRRACCRHGDAQPATQAADWTATQLPATAAAHDDFAHFDETQPSGAPVLPEVPSQAVGMGERDDMEHLTPEGAKSAIAHRCDMSHFSRQGPLNR